MGANLCSPAKHCPDNFLYSRNEPSHCREGVSCGVDQDLDKASTSEHDKTIEEQVEEAEGTDGTEETETEEDGAISETLSTSSLRGCPYSYVSGILRCPRKNSLLRQKISSELKELDILSDAGELNPDFCSGFSKTMLEEPVCSSMVEGAEAVTIEAYRGDVNIQLKRLIGLGGFGYIFYGTWEGRQVAIKVVAGKSMEGLSQVERAEETKRQQMNQMEAIIMSMVNHENVVTTYQVACGPDELPPGITPASINRSPSTPISFYIIMEHARLGSLWAGLVCGRFHRTLNMQSGGLSLNAVDWDAWAVLETLKEITRGLMYLHSQGIIHGDMKAANVLMGQNEGATAKDRRGFTARITDFGFSRIAVPKLGDVTQQENDEDFANFQAKASSYSTVTHVAPELLADGLLTGSADIYALGIVMWEMYTALEVYSNMGEAEIKYLVTCHGYTPEFPLDAPSSYVNLAQSCWNRDYTKRPSASDVLEQLEAIQSKLCPLGPYSPNLMLAGSAPASRRRSLQVSDINKLVKPMQPAPVRRASESPKVAQHTWVKKNGGLSIPSSMQVPAPAGSHTPALVM